MNLQLELANLLALTFEDVPSGDWKFEIICNIMPKTKPDCKKIHQLLNVNHNSALHEMERTFRVFDHSVNFVI